MTAKSLRKIALDARMYATPELNDQLYAHYKVSRSFSKSHKRLTVAMIEFHTNRKSRGVYRTKGVMVGRKRNRTD